MKQKITHLLIGAMLGATLFGGSVAYAASEYLKAYHSSQAIYLDGQRLELEAYSINGSNYVKLRDVGWALDFSVTYDAATNTVRIHPDEPYTEEVKEEPAAGSPLTYNADGSINVPSDGSQYVPQAGDVIRCDNGTNYAIADVSRYDKNMFASGPVGALPEPACDWSGFDQPELPEAEARQFLNESGNYLFVRNLYETRRMLYTLYNAMGENSATWSNGSAVQRKDGTPWVHVRLTTPDEITPYTFWPWREDEVTDLFHSRPAGTFYIEVWDVYKNGVFTRTEYNIRAK